jgi:hypothetical protein
MSYPFTPGTPLNASDLNAVLATALAGSGMSQAAFLALLTAVVANLPTTLPGTAGVLWNNAGVVCIS